MKRYLLPLLLLPLLSCHDYRTTTYEVGARVVLEDKGKVADIGLYMFGGDHRLVGHTIGSVAAPFNLTSYNNQGPITIVAWGNSHSALQRLVEPELGTHFADHRVELPLSGESFSGMALNEPPRDLFYGTSLASNFPNEFRDDTHGNNRYWLDPIRMNRVVSGYTIIVRHAKAAFGGHPEAFRFVVKHPYNALNYAGQPIGSQSCFTPRSSYDSLRDELTTSLTFALSTESRAITVEIYDSNESGAPIYSSAGDPSAHELRLISNKMHEIIIDYIGDFTLVIDGADWDEEIVNQPF